MSTEASSKYIKLQKRGKVAVGRSKSSKDNVEALDSRRNGVRGHRKAQGRTMKEDDASNVDDRLHNGENGGRSVRSNNIRTDKGENSKKRSMRSNTRDQNLRTDKGVNGGKSERANTKDRNIRTDKGEDSRRRSERLNTIDQNIRTDKGENGRKRSERSNTRDQNIRTDKGENGGRRSERSNNRDHNIRTDKGKNSGRSERSNARDHNIRTDKGENSGRSERLNIRYENIQTDEGENSGKRSMRSNTRDQNIGTGQEGDDVAIDRKRGFKQVNSNLKQKRVHADPNHAKDKRDFSKAGWKKLKDDDYVKDNRTIEGPRDSEQSSRTNSRTGRRSKENKSLDLKAGTSLRAKGEILYKGKNVGLDGNEFLGPAKKKYPDKRSLSDDSVVLDDRRKRKKRGIRLDPYDISSKRLDDGMANNDNTKEKKEDLEDNKNAEMSMNAQFRAIQPSPSILSFVEENLLGRRREIELRRAGYNTELSVPLDNIPSSTSSERERIEETVFRNKLTFFAAAKVSSSLPPLDLPEIAFAGRSNVGKSSLLNALTRQWGVVRTSDKPGLTQTINFFTLGPKLCLVDLPGYGFAYAKEEVKEAWEEFVKEYVSTRVGLKRVCLLIDTKWGMKPRDYELINLMERAHTKYQIILTKTDTVFPIDVARRAMQIEETLKANKSAVQPVMMVSSKSGAGIRSLRTALSRIARFVKL
ncbi:hypothetical protein LguiA_020787 [Lonicera macranthoides]